MPSPCSLSSFARTHVRAVVSVETSRGVTQPATPSQATAAAAAASAGWRVIDGDGVSVVDHSVPFDRDAPAEDRRRAH